MKNNRYQFEKTTTEVATATIAAEQLVFYGREIGVAMNAAVSGELLTVGYGGEIAMTKEGAGSGQAFAVGDPVYWDVAQNRATKTVSTNPRIGVAKEAAITTATYLPRVSLLRFTDDIGVS
jgi:hypothetical protein